MNPEQAKLYDMLQVQRTDWVLNTNHTNGFMGASQLGKVRSTNQDRIGVLTAPGRCVAVLCDGMGGMAQGEWAADIALSSVLADFAGNAAVATPAGLQATLERANKQVYPSPAGPGRSGTTIVVLVLTEVWTFLSWAGDSRAYFIAGSDVIQLTEDDTVRAALERHKGHPCPEAHPGLTQGIGLHRRLEEPHVIRLPSISQGYYLLASDGAFAFPGFAAVAPQGPASVLEASLDAGGNDNASVIAMATAGPWLRDLKHQVYL